MYAISSERRQARNKMKVLLINGSLQGEKSHSLMVARNFVEGISQETEATVKELHLGKMRIEHCTGCFCCWKVTPGQCAIKDDMEIIRKEMLESDVIILCFPLYFFGVSSKMKTLLDRLLPFKLPYNGRLATPENINIMDFRYDFSDKKLVLVSTCAHASTDIVYEPVLTQFDLAWGKGTYERVFCPQGEILMLDQMKPILNNYLKKVQSAGAELAKEGKLSEETVKRVNAPLIPVRAVEKMMTGFWEDYPQE